jgi:hypothetical protein
MEDLAEENSTRKEIESDDNLTFICKNSDESEKENEQLNLSDRLNRADADEETEFNEFKKNTFFKYQRYLYSQKKSSHFLSDNSDCEFFDALSNTSSHSDKDSFKYLAFYLLQTCKLILIT